ncbi:hypothetical protein [Streptomyces alboflavus]|uniref:hypothetical protein n=1 Tax=Streptomyces alboflavus TaxID=67267 RepID=UPI000F657A5D|nr:hypothetical protein [Streptomyces alboflavus]
MPDPYPPARPVPASAEVRNHAARLVGAKRRAAPGNSPPGGLWRALPTYISGAMLGVLAGYVGGRALGSGAAVAVCAVLGGAVGLLATRRYLRWPEAQSTGRQPRPR